MCGSKENLEIDHVDRSKKLFPVWRLWPAKLLPDVFLELDKCQLLCKTHHIEKTQREFSGEERGFQHGTMYGWMKKKCVCDECAVSKRIWYDTRNEKLRTGKRGPYNKS